MDSFIQDLRFSARLLLRTPALTATAVLALALGIGANSSIFTIVNAVLLEALPFKDPERLVVVWEQNTHRPGRPNVVSPANYLRWRERTTAFEQMAAFYDWRANLTGDAAPEELVAQDVTWNFFSTLGVSPLLGRTFTSDEGPEGHNRVVVLSYPLWQRRFGGSQDVLGRSVQLHGRPYTVIGVMPRDVGLFLKAGSLVGKPADLWTTFAFTSEHRLPRGRYLLGIARLKSRVTLPEARAQMATIAAGLAREFPEFDTGWGVNLVPVPEELSGEYRLPLLVLMGSVAFVLLIACANVANLLLARSAARRHEIAVRLALGAGRGRLIRQLLVESILLASCGGLLGLLFSRWGADALLALSPVDLQPIGRFGSTTPVLAFTGTISLGTAMVCGLAPAFESSRADVQDALREGARHIGGAPRSRRLRHAFVIAEVALAVVLLVGAGLLLRSLANLRAVNPGFDPRNLLTFRVSLPPEKYSDPAKVSRFFEQAEARLAAMPGVRSAGAISFLPFAGLGAATGFTIVGQPPPAPGEGPVVDFRVCDNGLFTTMQLPLVRGRLFTAHELSERSDVAIINETMARRYFAGEDPIGRQVVIAMTSTLSATKIVGVVGDMKYVDLTTAPRAMAFWPHTQLGYTAMTFTLRTVSDPIALAPLAIHEIQALDKDQPVSDVRTMDQWVGKSLSQSRFSSLLLTLLASLALLLAALGIYGVISYAVSQRTTEIGVRKALGATSADIVALVLLDGMRLAAIGLGIGILLALALNRALTTLLYQTPGTDPVTFARVVGLLAVVAAVASYLPATRAARLAPTEALRDE
jgi:putative ABC transport system permease protein